MTKEKLLKATKEELRKEMLSRYDFFMGMRMVAAVEASNFEDWASAQNSGNAGMLAHIYGEFWRGVESNYIRTAEALKDLMESIERWENE